MEYLKNLIAEEISALGWVIVGILMLMFLMAISDITDSFFDRLWKKKD